MAIANRERVGRCLDLLRDGLAPYITQKLSAKHGADWVKQAKLALSSESPAARPDAKPESWDIAALLSILIGLWATVFRFSLSKTDRSMMGELQEVRNRWAHQEAFTLDDTNRALDSMKRLLQAIGALQWQEVDAQLQEVLRQKYEDLTKREIRRSSVTGIEGKPTTNLRPWRDIVLPHPDVASGRYQQAEFAADLGQVHGGGGLPEYSNPKEFFSRTYMTEGLRHVLKNALQRLTGNGGDPVIELMTNFGGGKTHTMLALYHLFGGARSSDLAGVDALLAEAGSKEVPKAKRAVFVGTMHAPGKSETKPDGTRVQTLWGEIAWQLLGKDGYALVQESDQKRTNPGKDLIEVFKRAAPCLILIDEWVAFVRQLYGDNTLAAGSFDTNLTFAQTLTEAAKQVPKVLVVASLPSSDIEIGGDAGKEALTRLKNTFDRVQSTWKPASPDESFEIVRRRLFQPVKAEDAPARDAVAHAFVEMYRSAEGDFPADCRESDYERQIRACYPIHPELLERLYKDWSTLDRFQRTRGMLRLMASVIHSLWERQDQSLLILPAMVPIDDNPVQYELTRYMDDPWTPVLNKDVDGPTSVPLQVDRESPNLGRFSAARRVARTIYLGSAPTLHTAHRGLDDKRIKLGCAQPGEAVAIFGDALRRLSDKTSHLFVDGNRYWFSTQASVTRLAQDRAAQIRPEEVEDEIVRRLKDEQSSRGDFPKVYSAPVSSAEVPDEREARLIVLHPRHAHGARDGASAAMKEAKEVFERRGATPRLYRNTLVFVGADRTRLDELGQAVRQFLAWRSIKTESKQLNLDNFQGTQAETRTEQSEQAVKERIPEAFCWLIVPTQSDAKGVVTFEESRLQGRDRLAPRASKKMVADGTLATRFGAPNLRNDLDRVPLLVDGRVEVAELLEHYAKFPYLQRVTRSDVVIKAIEDGLALISWEQDSFAYADLYDAATSRFRGLVKPPTINRVAADGRGLLVASALAKAQFMREAEAAAAGPEASPPTGGTPGGTPPSPGGLFPPQGSPPSTSPSPTKPILKRRVYGRVKLRPERIASAAQQIAQEIVAHLNSLDGAQVEVRLEITANVEKGIDERTLNIVTQNAATLKFEQMDVT